MVVMFVLLSFAFYAFIPAILLYFTVILIKMQEKGPAFPAGLSKDHSLDHSFLSISEQILFAVHMNAENYTDG